MGIFRALVRWPIADVAPAAGGAGASSVSSVIGEESSGALHEQELVAAIFEKNISPKDIFLF